MKEKLNELLNAVAEEEGMSLARIARKLSLPQSQLFRMLAVMGPDESVGGLNLLELRGNPPRLFLTARGHEWRDGS